MCMKIVPGMIIIGEIRMILRIISMDIYENVLFFLELMIKNLIFIFFSVLRVERKIYQNFTLKISSDRLKKNFLLNILARNSNFLNTNYFTELYLFELQLYILKIVYIRHTQVLKNVQHMRRRRNYKSDSHAESSKDDHLI